MMWAEEKKLLKIVVIKVISVSLQVFHFLYFSGSDFHLTIEWILECQGR